MQFTAAQAATFKTWLTNNASGLSDQDAANLANAQASPAYFVHRTDVSRAQVYKTTVAAGDSSTGAATTWDWTGYKNQGSPEQDAWKEMFMGGSCDFNNLNNRAGVLAIFGTAGAGGTNRTHAFNVGKRKATNLEKLFVVVVGTVPNNTGNVTANTRGDPTNPDLLGIDDNGAPFQGNVTANQVAEVRASG